jgi:hypothetical protein
MNNNNCKTIIVITLLALLASACSSATINGSKNFTPAAMSAKVETISPTATQKPMERPAAEIYRAVYDPESKRVILIGVNAGNRDIWAYEVANQKLVRLKDKPANSMTCVDYNIKAGGIVTNSQKTGTTWIYDPVKEEWGELADSPTQIGLYDMCSFVYDIESDRQVKLYSPNSSGSDTRTLVFDYSTNSWENILLDPSPIFALGLAMAYDAESYRIILWDASLEKIIWAFNTNTTSWDKVIYTGGPNKGGTFGAAVYVPDLDRTFFYYLDQFYAYDLNTNSWEQAKGELKPGNRLSQSLAYDPIAKKIVMYGGTNESETTYYNDLWLYDPQTGEWTEQELP